MSMNGAENNKLGLIGKITAWSRKNVRDIVIVASIAVGLYTALYFLLGFGKYGLGTPIVYWGGDEFSALSTAKTIIDRGWFWYPDRIAAPFDNGLNLSFSASLLQNVDMVLMFLISRFTDDPVVVVNLVYLMTFPMCGINAYIVMRTIKLNRIISSFGSCVFALTPYIFFRSTSHLCLAFCIFVPFSILLCVWAFDGSDSTYMQFGRGFFRKKNVVSVLMCLLIANNGIGYYPIFTCFFLFVVMLCRLLNERKISVVKPALKLIGFIAVFFIIAVLPHYIYLYFMDGVSTAVRGRAGAEIYGLKIAQLFLPLEGHGIPFLSYIINEYNTKMPNVNENQGAYLGIAGIIGFLLSLLVLLAGNNGEKKQQGELYLMSRLNICAILLSTMGGFGSIIGIALTFLRGLNRISIFISFISVLTLCLLMQKYADRPGVFAAKAKRAVSAGIGVAFAALCFWDLLSVCGVKSSLMEQNKQQMTSDKAFVEAVEEQLPEGSMVFQLPYHEYPEGGNVNNMSDYHLFIGQIFSDDLRWSYGAPKGGKADEWFRTAASLPVQEMIGVLRSEGYNGLYIDNRAYTNEELVALLGSIEGVLGSAPMTSANGNLSFFSLIDHIQ